ncbi:4-hydroxy-tetrahydrodipicolinate synthase [Colwellia sp. MT41]|uniref:4-hydroxy-tetrahydrodipicolinate synthase n=1 Tax=Colwellia marinimaniae TaxID=1513592 RepID=A0ABQ0MSP6_9GAMM|nr:MULTISPECIES: 4-hydroxy-tetrahydrodipicolinate synthase [Colwellia]ALO35488.1 4-hydroxy-tetrahydrodipicolinate synthase [Colwellia sp. MT41]GAW95398.1 4-hydroxy-tetrahydrodipicolinate synthase [Colwellia marinimaniae]
MKRLKAASLITAIKTPYTEKGEVCLKSYDFLIQQQIAAGVDGIVVGGTTGEGHLLSWEEHLMLIAHCVHNFGDKLIIVGNTGSNNTREAIKATEYGFAIGMDAALQINPYYGRTSLKGVIEHLKIVLDIGPAFIYNVPGRTGQDLTPEFIEPLASHKNFIGVKECAGNERIAYYEKQGIACWSGNDDESYAGRHEYGSHGVISVTSNIIPGIMRQLMDKENLTQTTQLNEQVADLMAWLFCEPNPIAINTALMMTDAVPKNIRLPYQALTLEQRQQGLKILTAIASKELVGNSLSLLEDADFNYCI